MFFELVELKQLAPGIVCCPCPSQAPRTQVHTKILDMDPEQLPADFLVEISASLSRYGCRVVSVGVRAGCIQLVLDLQMLVGSSTNRAFMPMLQLQQGPSGSQITPGEGFGSRITTIDVTGSPSSGGSEKSAGWVVLPAGQDVGTIQVSSQDSLLLAKLHPADWLQLLRVHLPAFAGDFHLESSVLDRWGLLQPWKFPFGFLFLGIKAPL